LFSNGGGQKEAEKTGFGQKNGETAGTQKKVDSNTFQLSAKS